MAEKTVADILAVVRTVDPACQPLAIRFPHTPKGGRCELEHLATVRPTYGAASTEVVLPAAVMDRPLPSADRAVHRLSERYLTMRLAEAADGQHSYAALVRNVVSRTLSEGRYQQQIVARSLGCTSRTLQRRLEQEGTTLREIVDQIRKERAGSLLSTGVSTHLPSRGAPTVGRFRAGSRRAAGV
jgi:AraC-like DNA-binding protein